MINKKFIFFIFLILLVFGILVVFIFDIPCVFKSIFGISCPGCGLTRGFRALLNGDVITAFHYNILTIPMFLFLFIFCILFILDYIKKSNYSLCFLFIFKNNYLFVLLLVFISFIINNINGI